MRMDLAITIIIIINKKYLIIKLIIAIIAIIKNKQKNKNNKLLIKMNNRYFYINLVKLSKIKKKTQMKQIWLKFLSYLMKENIVITEIIIQL